MGDAETILESFGGEEKDLEKEDDSADHPMEESSAEPEAADKSKEEDLTTAEDPEDPENPEPDTTEERGLERKDEATPRERDEVPSDEMNDRTGNSEISGPQSPAMEKPTADMKEPTAVMEEPTAVMKEPAAPPEKDITNKNLEADILASMKEPICPTLEDLVRDGSPFALPWSCAARDILSCFESQEMHSGQGPWRVTHPFDPAYLMATAMPETVGGTASFRDGFSTRAEASSEHLSAAAGLTVGYPFLNAGAHVDYDRTVIKHSNGIQASRNASCRIGRVILEQTPPMAPEAVRILTAKDGHGCARFRAMFGNYYVCGYELGADAGACLSATARDSSTHKTLTVTASVKVLWMSKSAAHTESSDSTSALASMMFSGYNSLGDISESRKSESLSPFEQAQLGAMAQKWLKTIGALEDAARTRMREVGLHDGQRLPLSACAPICRSGLVVRLLMAPFAHLNEYVKYAASGGAIALDDRLK